MWEAFEMPRSLKGVPPCKRWPEGCFVAARLDTWSNKKVVARAEQKIKKELLT